MKIKYKSKHLGYTVDAERIGQALVVDSEHNQIYLAWSGFPIAHINFESFKLAKEIARLMITTFDDHLMYLGRVDWLIELGQITNNQTNRLVMAETLKLLEKEPVANEETIQKCIKIAQKTISSQKFRKG
jgi:hypothetical protein